MTNLPRLNERGLIASKVVAGRTRSWSPFPDIPQTITYLKSDRHHVCATVCV